MGTCKKLTLASLVTIMVVLSFVIGFVPAHDLGAIRAASDDGEFDISTLLGAIMDAKAVQSIVPQLKIEAAKVIAPPGSGNVPLGVKAAVIGTGVSDVRYVANAASEGGTPWANERWTGSVFSGASVTTPYDTSLNIRSLMDSVAQTIYVYALTNTTQAVKQTSFLYEDVNMMADRIALVVQTKDLDSDGNGYPDNIMDVLDGELWLTTATQNGVERTVAIANLSDGAKAVDGEVTVTSGNATVTGPDLAALQTAFGVDIEDAWLVVNAVDDLAGLLDEVDGDASAQALADWAAGVNAIAPGALSAMAQYTEVSLVYTTDSGTVLAEIDDLTGTGLSVEIELTGLDIASSENPQIWSFPTAVSDDGVGTILTNDAEADQVWSLKAESPTIIGSTGLSMTTETLSVFAPFSSGMQILSADPSVMLIGLDQDVQIHGVFPVGAMLSVAEAANAYAVYVGAAPINEATDRVTFVANGPNGEAITELDTENDMFVTVPNKSEAGLLNVRVVDLVNPANNAETADLIEVFPTYILATSASGNGASEVTITLDPVSSDARLADGTFRSAESVAASVSFSTAALSFEGWTLNGTDIGAANPVTFDMPSDNSTLVANFAPKATYTVATFTVGNIEPATVVLTPASSPGLAAGEFFLNTEVSAEVVFDAGTDTFRNWFLDGAEIGATTTVSFTVTGDHNLVANFIEVPARIVVTAGTGGTVTVTPPEGVSYSPNGFYPQGTVLTLTATPDNGFRFLNWTGANAGDLLPDTETAEVTIAMDANKAVTANFENIVIGITSIEPAEAWIFGGVVAQINGAGLTEDVSITIGSQSVQGFRAAEDGSSIEVVIPALTDTTSVSGLASVEADVTVTAADASETATLENGFTYKRYESAGGINTTAFQFMTNAAVDVDVTLGASNDNFAELHIPVLASAKPTGELTYGLARATDTGTKQNTAALGTAFITDGVGAPDVRAFDIHFYASTEAAKQTANTPSVGSATLATNTAVLDLDRVDENGVPNENPFTLTFPVTEASLTAGDVREGLAMWGVESELDYVTNTLTSVGPATELQSVLLNNEVEPNLTSSVSDDTDITTVWKARLYTLQAFSLRMNAALPDDVAAQIVADNANGFFSGRQAGGWNLTVSSSLGGLAWIDRIEFVNSSGQVVATTSASNLQTAPGTNEYLVEFTAPRSSQSGVMDVSIFLRSNPDTAAVTLVDFAEYTPATRPDWLWLVALIIALLGLASGGSSGGGGGGPCFIATAAYGTPMAADIDALRAVRDTFMLDNAAGSAFVDAYYRVSPAIADAVAQSPLLAALVRVLLVPAIFLGKVAVAMPTLTAFVGLSLGVAFMLRRRARKA